MSQEKTLQDILETVQFIKENGASKEDLKDFPTGQDPKGFVTKDYLKQKLDAVKDEFISHVDGFIGLHKKIETEQVAIKSKINRLEKQITSG